jgi:hypothetical protein
LTAAEPDLIESEGDFLAGSFGGTSDDIDAHGRCEVSGMESGDWRADVSYKETLLGDLRVLCAGRSQQMIVHYDSRMLLVVIKNGARLEHEKEVILHIEGYSTESGRDAHLVRNEQPVNLDMLILGELRVQDLAAKRTLRRAGAK